MKTKLCSRCGEVKPFDQFSRDCRAKDGLQSACRSCMKQHRITHKVEIAKHDRLYHSAHRPQQAARNRRYHAANPAAKSASTQRWDAAHPGAAAARVRVQYALKAGRLIKPISCELCGSQPEILQGHHHLGYEHPLQVQWLCSPCHGMTFSSYIERERRAA